MALSNSFGDALITAEQAWRAADHMLTVSFPVVQDPKLLLRSLEHLDKAARTSISSVLKMEYVHKRVDLSKSGEQNMISFFEQCAERYGLNDKEKEGLRELLDLGRRHKGSGMEFSQKGKMIILDDDIGSVTLSITKMQELSEIVRKLQLNLRKQFQES